jgi:hypothetical protein
MVASPRPLRILVIAQFRQLLIEGLHSGFALFQQIVNHGLLAILNRLQLRHDFFNIVNRFSFWTSATRAVGN